MTEPEPRKSKRFEKRVRHHVKDRRDKRADAAGEKHITELRNGRISENFFDVVLREADRRGKNRRRRSR